MERGWSMLFHIQFTKLVYMSLNNLKVTYLLYIQNPSQLLAFQITNETLLILLWLDVKFIIFIAIKIIYLKIVRRMRVRSTTETMVNPSQYSRVNFSDIELTHYFPNEIIKSKLF